MSLSERIRHLAPVLSSLIACQAGLATESVDVLKKAPPRDTSSFVQVYDSEDKVTERYEKLCAINIEKSVIVSGIDMTGQAMKAALERAARCGANGLIVHYNSSNEKPADQRVVTQKVFDTYVSRSKSSRQSETVRATAILIPGTPPPPRSPAPNQMKAGFRDLTWGSPLDATFVPEAPTNTSDDLQTYVRASDSRVIGSATASTLYYRFSRARLAVVAAQFAKAEWASVKRTLDAEWGPPRLCKPEPATCFWRSEAAADKSSFAVLTEAEAELELLIGNPALADELAREQRSGASGL